MKAPMNRNEPLPPSTALVRGALMLLLIATVYSTLYFFFQEPIDAAGRWLSRTLGYAGVFLFVYLVDTFIVPATADLVFLFTLEWNPVILLTVISAASVLGGTSGFLIGRRLNHIRWVQGATRSYHERGDRLIRKFGLWGIALAAFTPLPYSTISWIAGMLDIPLPKYILVSLLRAPRFVIYYAAIKGGFLMIDSMAGV